MKPTAPRMLDGKSFAIGILSVTACVLFVGFIILSQTPAYGIGMNDRGGDYIMLTQQLSTTSEGVVVIDAAAKQMIVYQFDYNNKSLNILRAVPLGELPKPQRDREAPQRPVGGRR